LEAGGRELTVTVEKRKHRRIKARWPITVVTDNGTIKGQIGNISVDGLFMRSEEPLRLNKTFHMQINPPNHQGIDFTGRVIWSDLYALVDQNIVYGTGICFVRISDGDRHLFDEILSARPAHTK
jgi:hypothetical protein